MHQAMSAATYPVHPTSQATSALAFVFGDQAAQIAASIHSPSVPFVIQTPAVQPIIHQQSTLSRSSLDEDNWHTIPI